MSAIEAYCLGRAADACSFLCVHFLLNALCILAILSRVLLRINTPCARLCLVILLKVEVSKLVAC